MYEATPKNFETIWNRAERELAGPYAGVLRSFQIPLGAVLASDGSTGLEPLVAAADDGVGYGLHPASNSTPVISWNGTDQTALFVSFKLPRTITKQYSKRDVWLILTMDKNGSGSDNTDLSLGIQPYERGASSDTDRIAQDTSILLDAKAADMSAMREYAVNLGTLLNHEEEWGPGEIVTLQLTPVEAPGTDLNLSIANIEIEIREHLNPAAPIARSE